MLQASIMLESEEIEVKMQGISRFLDYTVLEEVLRLKCPKRIEKMQAMNKKYEQDLQTIRDETNQRLVRLHQ